MADQLVEHAKELGQTLPQFPNVIVVGPGTSKDLAVDAHFDHDSRMLCATMQQECFHPTRSPDFFSSLRQADGWYFANEVSTRKQLSSCVNHAVRYLHAFDILRVPRRFLGVMMIC